MVEKPVADGGQTIHRFMDGSAMKRFAVGSFGSEIAAEGFFRYSG